MGDDDKKLPSWVTTLAKAVGIALAACIISLGSSWGLTHSVADDASADAKAKAEEETDRAEMASAIYLSSLNDKIQKTFDAYDEDLDALDDSLSECEVAAKQALLTAEVALRIAESRIGRGAVERTFERVERDEPHAVIKPKPSARKDAPPLPTYQLRRTEK